MLLVDLLALRPALALDDLDHAFLLRSTSRPRSSIAERYQVNYPFLLYAGRISPHKNVVRIIEAFAALKAQLEKEAQFPDLKLIIIGDELSKHPDLRRAVIKSRVQHDVRFLGFVPIGELRIFYDLAKIFVFPSLYEGFGLPPLEAMAHGTPVVTSNTSSIPEVVGDAAVMVNPENVFEIAHALHRVLLDQAVREKLKARGVLQAHKFPWDDSVRRMLEVYYEVVRRWRAGQRRELQHPHPRRHLRAIASIGRADRLVPPRSAYVGSCPERLLVCRERIPSAH